MSLQPNILWICTDQQRYDTIHCLNNPHINTPNLDRLCAEGVAFSRAYSQSPICSPSRASFLTGLYPGYVGVNRNGLEDFPEKPHVELITKRLTDTGYTCGLSGKLHIASAWNGRENRIDDGYTDYNYSHAPTQGIGFGANDYVEWVRSLGRFDEVFDMSNYDDVRHAGARYQKNVPAELHQSSWCTDRALDLIMDHSAGGSKAGAPWLYSVNTFDPHPAFDAPLDYENRYNADALPPPLFKESDILNQEKLSEAFFQGKPAMPGDRQVRNKANYYGMIELIDENVGRLLDGVDNSGQRENTVVIFTSDHGEMLGDHGLGAKGCRFYEGAVRVPLIISWPGHFQAGVVADGLTELTDLAPTIADLTGLPPAKSHGRSLLPILTGTADPAVNHAYVRCEYYDTLDMQAPYAIDEHTETWATMYRDDRWKLVVYHGVAHGELYDLENDPNEFANLWNDDSVKEIKVDLMKSSFDASIRGIDIGPQLIGRY